MAKWVPGPGGYAWPTRITSPPPATEGLAASADLCVAAGVPAGGPAPEGTSARADAGTSVRGPPDAVATLFDPTDSPGLPLADLLDGWDSAGSEALDISDLDAYLHGGGPGPSS